MPALDDYRLMAKYNQWMNERLYGACARIDDEARKQDRGAYFRSIHGTLNHLLLGDRLWLGRFLDDPVSYRGLDQELYGDFDALRRERAVTDGAILTWLDGLEGQDLAQELRFVSQVDPGPKVVPLSFAMTHFFNHQTHHRGQLTTLLSQCGLDYGTTDLMWIPGGPLRNA